METRPRPSVDLVANCACGAVTLAFKGRVRAMFMCSCEDCQKATGTGHSTVALVAAPDLTVTGPTKSFSRKAASGAIFTRCFCPECGTPLYGASSRAPDVMMLAVGFFAGQNDWYAPSQLIFARSHRDWDIIDAALPKYETYRDPGEL